MGHHSHKEHTGQAWAFLFLSVGGLLLLVYGFGGAIEGPAKELLDLSVENKDIYWIPVGGAIFVVFWKIMDTVLFRPLVKVAEAREALTEGAEVSAATAKEQTAALEAEYEEKLTGARVAGMQKKAAILGKARAEAQAVVDKASEAALSEIMSARESIAKEGEALKELLLNQSDELVNAVVEKATSTPEPVKSVRS